MVSIALGASPSMTTVRPQGARRGSEVEVSLTGARLADAKEVLFYVPGITVTSLNAVNDGQVKATFKIAPDVQLGQHDFRLRTATGISELRLFSVGALPEVNEAEPNNDFAKPQPIPLDVTVNGVAENEDVDYFAIEAKKGERITAEVEGIRLGSTLFDPAVAILDAKRFELASSDDAPLVWKDGVVSVLAPADGTYIIQVRESAYAGNGSCLYRLHVGRFPRPTATLPAGGKLGESVAIRWIGDASGESSSTLTLPKEFDRTFGIFAQDAKGIAPYPNAFRLSTFGNLIETEPNDDHAHATTFAPPLALNGVIGKPGDVDHFIFAAKKGQAFDIRVFAAQLRSPLDSVLYVGKKGGGALAGNDDAEGRQLDGYIRFGVPEDGEYVVWLTDKMGKGGADFFYRIEVTPFEPRLTLYTTNERLPYGTGNIVAAVPQGNRQAILVYANRFDFGGDLKLSAEGLPEGVTADIDAMAASQPVARSFSRRSPTLRSRARSPRSKRSRLIPRPKSRLPGSPRRARWSSMVRST
jgi:hypothetical protein